jgi:2-keto-4-pentenoate hydratase/2-oxohepta-3-ene-1,7-dioic acid hydratase in catechol pathway
MRFANYDGRLTLLDADGLGVDVHRASGAALPWSVPEAYERWSEVLAWARSYSGAGDIVLDEALIGPPSPAPGQMLAVGINYATHAEEAGFPIPEVPMIFPKTAPATAGPFEEIGISTDTVDWEIELAVVIGKPTRSVTVEDAWDHVAGLTVSQDLSERTIQARPQAAPQFSLGKSLPKFGPTGPYLVTLDEVGDPDNLELTCLINGEEVQRGNTSDFIFSVPQVIAYLSWATTLRPGDVILTGTPSGIGATRTPPRFLRIGDVLESRIEGLGAMRHQIVADRAAAEEPQLAGQR